jgi:hypothetical protein
MTEQDNTQPGRDLDRLFWEVVTGWKRYSNEPLERPSTSIADALAALDRFVDTHSCFYRLVRIPESLAMSRGRYNCIIIGGDLVYKSASLEVIGSSFHSLAHAIVVCLIGVVEVQPKEPSS